VSPPRSFLAPRSRADPPREELERHADLGHQSAPREDGREEPHEEDEQAWFQSGGDAFPEEQPEEQRGERREEEQLATLQAQLAAALEEGREDAQHSATAAEPREPREREGAEESALLKTGGCSFSFPRQGAGEGIISAEEVSRYPEVPGRPSRDYRNKPYLPLNGKGRGHRLPQLSAVMRTLGAKKYEFIGETHGKRMDFLTPPAARGSSSKTRPSSSSKTRPSSSVPTRQRPGTALSTRSPDAGIQLRSRPGTTLSSQNSKSVAPTSRPGTASSHRPPHSSRRRGGGREAGGEAVSSGLGGSKSRSAKAVLINPATLDVKASEGIARYTAVR